jgi:hypothetical protein
MIDVTLLQKTTAEAQERTAAQKRQKELQAQKQYLALKEEVENDLRSLNAMLLGAADEGKNTYKVCRLQYGDYKNLQDRNLTVDNLTDTKTIILYERLVELGLNPVFHYGHDGSGMEDWFDLIVSW